MVHDSETVPACSPSIEVVMLEVGQLHVKELNPNVMSPEQFAALIAEVEREGKPTKPIKARPDGESNEPTYEVVDGAHNLEAAKQLGLTHVPCEIIVADEFESHRQMLVSNQHGKHDPLIEGQVYAEMKRLKPMSNRQLALELGITEGKVRLGLTYVEAFGLRNDYAGDPEKAAEDISGLKAKQVREYVRLPRTLRDGWLNEGANCGSLSWALKDESKAFCESPIAEAAMRKQDSFRCCCWQLKELYEWRCANDHISGINDHIRVAASHGLDAYSLDQMPYKIDGENTQPLLSAEEWELVVGQSLHHSRADEDDFERILELEIERWMRRNELDPCEYCDPKLAEQWQILVASETLPFVVEAPRMSIREKVRLAQLESKSLPDSLQIEAKRRTCDYLIATRTGARSPEPARGSTLDEILASFSAELGLARLEELAAEIYADRDAAVDLILNAYDAEMNEAGDDVSCSRFILDSRLKEMQFPEIVLLAAAFDPRPETLPFERWTAALGAEDGPKSKN